jgi:hypothetical protein
LHGANSRIGDRSPHCFDSASARDAYISRPCTLIPYLDPLRRVTFLPHSEPDVQYRVGLF